MIVVDSSAVVAIIGKERGYERIAEALERTDVALMSVANLFEVAIVVMRRFGNEGKSRLSRWRDTFSVELRDVDSHQLEIAIDAYGRFGRGMGHPAGLNFGDCFAYALARSADMPLLYKGDDFGRTDIRSALSD